MNDPDAPIPTTSFSRANTHLRRVKTLTRPERQEPQTPLVHAPLPESRWDAWRIFCRIVTIWAPNWSLSACGRMKTPAVRQAWREKVTLCLLAVLMWGVVGFYTVGMRPLLCPVDNRDGAQNYIHFDGAGQTLGIRGWQFNVSQALIPASGPNFYTLANEHSGQDITPFFIQNAPESCGNLTAAASNLTMCFDDNGYGGCPLYRLSNFSLTYTYQLYNTSKKVGFDWDQIQLLTNAVVLNGKVLNFDPYMNMYPDPLENDPVDEAIRMVLRAGREKGGRDVTRLFYSHTALKKNIECLQDKYIEGYIQKSPGCLASDVVLYVTLIVILLLVLARFFMACIFSWFLSHRLARTPKTMANMGGAGAAGSFSPASSSRTAVGSGSMNSRRKDGYDQTNVMELQPSPTRRDLLSPSPTREGTPFNFVTPAVSTDSLPIYENGSAPNALVRQPSHIGVHDLSTQPYTLLLVTAYSEGEGGLRNTISSLAETAYSDERKLIFIVCDGYVTGKGEKMSTPDIVLSMIERDDGPYGEPSPMSYISIGPGEKAVNKAKVYTGHYTASKGHRTPVIVVIKSGATHKEETTAAKPGNRGKRDGQLILMNFMARVLYNDRMTALDYDLFRKCQYLMNTTPDNFELVLMVDADTRVYQDSLKLMSNAMQNDDLIMGLCGETRIANKTETWVTMIQVFEYYISHHLSKGFESVFGGVTCLPGCFSMYRLKAPKLDFDGSRVYVPVLAKPEIVQEYGINESQVVSLHQKNLLLLGEDRFLTTLMLRNFPHRKMVFVPQAVCVTVVPHTMSMLLSQRRRWINSTIHNLFELVRVRNLCGTFCFSMQFVVFTDLIGTIVLPCAIALTIYLLVQIGMRPPQDFADAIPILMLGIVLGLPAILILITTRRVVYVLWMLVYILALPIWNFLLPVYSLLKQDDFSWGNTRKVAGEKKGGGHEDVVGESLAASVPQKLWEEWQRGYLRKVKRENDRARRLASMYGTVGPATSDGFIRPQSSAPGFMPRPSSPMYQGYGPDETMSTHTYDESFVEKDADDVIEEQDASYYDDDMEESMLSPKSDTGIENHGIFAPDAGIRSPGPLDPKPRDSWFR